jgi:hypothetical protein
LRQWVYDSAGFRFGHWRICEFRTLAHVKSRRDVVAIQARGAEDLGRRDPAQRSGEREDRHRCDQWCERPILFALGRRRLDLLLVSEDERAALETLCYWHSQKRSPLSQPSRSEISPFIYIMRRGIALALLCGASAASSELGLTRPSLAPSARSSVYASKPTLQAAKAVAAPTITPSFYWALLPNFLYFVSLSFSAWSRRAAPLHMLCPLIV